MRAIAAARLVSMPLLLCASPVCAQQHAIDLPAGTLAIAADRLAQQAGISIAIADPALLRRKVARVRGTMTATKAVVAL